LSQGEEKGGNKLCLGREKLCPMKGGLNEVCVVNETLTFGNSCQKYWVSLPNPID